MNNELPLLTFTTSLYPNVKLDNALVIACQHLLGTTYNLFEELFNKGLKPENVYLLGKCYSTNDKVFDHFKEEGVHVSELSKAFDSHISFDEQFQSYIDSFIKEVPNTTQYDRVIILDDGGQLLSYANDFFKDFGKIVGIEQTSSGFNKLAHIKLNFPVINIARSKAKLDYETPLIAELVVENIEDYFLTKKISAPHIAIIGQGYIGKAVFSILKKRYYVSGFDIDKSYKDKLKDFDMIIGATGMTVLEPGDFSQLKDNTILMSVSSSDREFSASYLRALKSKSNNCHEDIEVNGITLLNSGFPINFTGSEHSLAPEKIQLTRALLLVGVYEALIKNFDKGFVELGEDVQKKILPMFKHQVDFSH